MAKPRLEKVRALFYVLQQITKRGCAYFDTASLFYADVTYVTFVAYVTYAGAA